MWNDKGHSIYSFDLMRAKVHFHKNKNVNVLAMCLRHYV
jgi:hypothetical protein